MQAAVPDRILRIKQVLDLTGLSRSTLYRMIHESTFPKQMHISRHCVGWRESEVRIWLENPISYSPTDLSSGRS